MNKTLQDMHLDHERYDSGKFVTKQAVKGDQYMRDLPQINGDQEAWLMDRLNDLISMALALHKSQGVRANEYAYKSAIRGLVEGQAIEIIDVFNMSPCWINLRKPPV